MLRNASATIETLRDAIEAGERGGTPRDRQLLLAFSAQLRLLATVYGDERHEKLLRHLTIVAEQVGDDGDAVLAPALIDKSAAERIVRWIHEEYDNPETNRDYRVAVRVFGKRVADGDVETDDNGIPTAMAWIQTGTPNSYDPSPNPSELLDWDDADALIDAARNSRDAALVAVMMDAGPRGGELFNMEIGDVTDSEQGLRLFVDGKTGQRPVTLIPSVPYLNRWLADHPGGADSDPLWSKLTIPEEVSTTRVYQVLKKLGERAGIDHDRQPLTPTNFRKSNASWLARTGANASLIEERQGRARGSDAVARYVATFGEANEQSAYARLHGRDVDQETAERRDVVACPRCEKENPPDQPKCVWCGQALDPQGAADAEATEQQVRQAIAELDAEAAEHLAEAINTLEGNPALRAAFLSDAGAGTDG